MKTRKQHLDDVRALVQAQATRLRQLETAYAELHEQLVQLARRIGCDAAELDRRLEVVEGAVYLIQEESR